jgi:hypothetical protein
VKPLAEHFREAITAAMEAGRPDLIERLVAGWAEIARSFDLIEPERKRGFVSSTPQTPSSDRGL